MVAALAQAADANLLAVMVVALAQAVDANPLAAAAMPVLSPRCTKPRCVCWAISSSVVVVVTLVAMLADAHQLQLATPVAQLLQPQHL